MAQQQISSISNGVLTVSISSTGATVKSVKDATGEEFIWQADPAFWAGSAPILFPVCGGLNGDTYRYNGAEYKLGRHGYIRFKEFEVTDKKADEIVFTSKSDAETLACYPFEYTLDVRFKLDKSKLITTYTVKNESGRRMYFSIGSHEGYALSYPLSDYTLEFDEKEEIPIYAETGERIAQKSVSFSENGALRLNFSAEQFEGKSVVFHPLCSKKVSLTNSHDNKSVTVDLSESEYLVFWTVATAPYLCIEPWNGFSDPADFSGDISEKDGIVALDADGVYNYSHTITFNN